MYDLQILENTGTMTSLEVAEITGKRHDNILSDIRDEINKLGTERGLLIFQETYYTHKQNGQSYPMFNLTKEGVLQLAARYDAVVRFKLIEKVTRRTPQTFAQALYLAAQQQEKIENLQLENKVQAQQIVELQPKALYYDLILQCKDLLSTTVIAKDYGLSAKALNKTLHEFGIQYNQSGMWFLYQKYAVYGYTQTKTTTITRSNGEIDAVPHMYWTQKGRIFLYEFLKDNGILPLIEKEGE